MPSDRPDAERAPSIPGQSFPRTARLRSASDFRRVYGRGVRAHGRLMVVVGLARQDGHRLGVAVSKEHGKAVRRNKLKRILREAFRLERAGLRGAFDLIVIPRRNEGRMVLAAVRAELCELVARLAAQDPGRRRRGRGPRRNRETEPR